MTVSLASEIDALVIGGGVAGLASAGALASLGHSVCVMERGPRFGQGASTHNSGVIHAGIYYPAGSLKARLCVDGRDRLYAFCAARQLPHRRTGKLIVAPDTDGAPLERLLAQGAGNDVRLEILEPAAVRRIQPGLSGTPALWSPDTGILDADAYVRALADEAARAGAALLPATAPTAAAPARGGGFLIETSRELIRARVVVNAAGLYADEMSTLFSGEAFRIWPCRGDYAEFRPAAGREVRLPIYPLPDPSGHSLGVHVVPTTGGTVLAGPTARYVDAKTDYASGRPTLDSFVRAVRLLMPGIGPGDLVEGPAGMRAKLHPPEASFADFLIRPDRLQPALIHAAGIDSPGLTASLAIGAAVAAMADDVLR